MSRVTVCSAAVMGLTVVAGACMPGETAPTAGADEVTTTRSALAGTGYVDQHDDGKLDGWTQVGREWVETGGVATPVASSSYQGFLIFNRDTANDGQLTAQITADPWNGQSGGVVLRWTSSSSYYFVAVKPGNRWSSGVYFCKDTMQTDSAGCQTVASPINVGTSFPMDIKVTGSTFEISVDGVLQGTVTDSAHPIGRVGYGYSAQWNDHIDFLWSMWTDAGVPVAMPPQPLPVVSAFSMEAALTSPNMSMPRIALVNTGSVSLNGFVMDYFFTSATVPQVEDWYTPESTISMDDLGGGLWRVRYTASSAVGAGATLSDSMNSVGLHNADWSSWNRADDPSCNGSASLLLNPNIVVYTLDGVPIWGNPALVGRDMIVDFSFDSTANPTPDASPNHNDGAVVGATLEAGQGVCGSKAYNFRWSTRDHIDAPYMTSQSVSKALTVSAWIYPLAWDNIYAGYNRIVSKQPAYLLRGANGVAQFQVLTAGHGFVGVSGAAPMTLATWHHLVGVFDGQSVKLYVDGALVASQTVGADTVVDNTGPISIGESGLLNEGFTGRIDNVQVLKSAMSAGAVTARWASGGCVDRELLHLPFESPGTPTADLTRHHHDGDVLGPTQLLGSGVCGSNAYSFSWLTRDRIEVPYATTQDATEELSVEAWVYPTAFDNIYAGYNRIVSKQPVYLLRGANGVPQFQILTANDGFVGVAGSAPMTLSTWHHLVGTFDGQTVRLYVDGAQVASTTLPAPDTIQNNSSPITVGEWGLLNEGFTGRIDGVRVGARALTAAEVTARHAAGAACTAAKPVKAMILVDQRLFTRLAMPMDRYRVLAENRRGFGIELRPVNGIDDWAYTAVKDHVKQAKAANPALEGVLFVGNIKLPSFYKPRNDNLQIRILPRYYEDLDGLFTKKYPDGWSDPHCTTTPGSVDCQVAINSPAGPYTVPAHDLDWIEKGPNPHPEIWAAFMPVGVTGTSNTYADFEAQLRPFLSKLIGFYEGGLTSNGRYYEASDGLAGDFELVWNAWGKDKIDKWGRKGPNGEQWGACVSSGTNVCYVRWPTETYASFVDFNTARIAAGWPGDYGWNEPSIFKAHLDGALYAVVDYTAHSMDRESVISSVVARTVVNGGLLMAISGCGVGGFKQPGSPSNFDDNGTGVSDNIMAAYLYGSSKALAALGDPFNRGHAGYMPTVTSRLRQSGAYLGLAHLERNVKLFDDSPDPYNLRENGMELLMGDPFMDLQN